MVSTITFELHTHTLTHTHTHTHTYIHTHTYLHTYTYIHSYIHTHTHCNTDHFSTHCTLYSMPTSCIIGRYRTLNASSFVPCCRDSSRVCSLYIHGKVTVVHADAFIHANKHTHTHAAQNKNPQACVRGKLTKMKH